MGTRSSPRPIAAGRKSPPLAPNVFTPWATWGTMPCSDVRISTSRQRELSLDVPSQEPQGSVRRFGGHRRSGHRAGRGQRRREPHGHRRRRKSCGARGHAEHPQHEPTARASLDAATDRWSAVGHRSRTAQRSRRPSRCFTGPYNTVAKPVDYVGNGVYTVDAHDLQRELLRRSPRTQTLPSPSPPPPPSRPPRSRADAAAELVVIQHGQAADRPQPRRAGDRRLRGAQRGGQPGRVAAGHAHAAVPRRDDEDRRRAARPGTGHLCVAARAKGFTGSTNPQAFSPWATPVGLPRLRPVRPQVVPLDRQPRAELPLHATIMETSATGQGEHRHRARDEGQVPVPRHREDPQARVLQALQAERPAPTGSASSTRATHVARRQARDPRVPDHPARRPSGADLRSSAIG